MLTRLNEHRIAVTGLQDCDVQVCFASLDLPEPDVQRMAGTLSPGELERAGRFRFERDRRRFVVSRAVLREILAARLGVEPQSVSFRYGRFGKPELAGDFEASRIRFNVSHSHEGALYAVAHDRNVGVDLEHIREIDDLWALAERCFSHAENHALRSLTEPELRKGFFNCWTRKEAFLKATGNGLSFPLDQFDVSLLPGPGRRSLKLRGIPAEKTPWTLVSLESLPAYAAALVVEGRKSCHITRHWPAESLMESGAGPEPESGSTRRQNGWASSVERPEDEIVA